MLSNDNSIYSKLNIGVSSAWSLYEMPSGRLGSLYRSNGTILLARSTDDRRYINLNIFRDHSPTIGHLASEENTVFRSFVDVWRHPGTLLLSCVLNC